MSMIIRLDAVLIDVTDIIKEQLDYETCRVSAGGPETDPHTTTGPNVRHFRGGKSHTRGFILQESSRRLKIFFRLQP